MAEANESMAAFHFGGTAMMVDGRPEAMNALEASVGFLDVLGGPASVRIGDTGFELAVVLDDRGADRLTNLLEDLALRLEPVPAARPGFGQEPLF